MILAWFRACVCCSLCLLLNVHQYNLVAYARSTAVNQKPLETPRVQLDSNSPPVVVSDELMYKSGTDERYRAAEQAISSGGGQNQVLKEAYDFKTFYSPEKWQPMLDDSDYEELEADVNKIKAARWETKKTQEQLDMEDNDDEEEDDSAKQEDETEDDEFDYLDYEAKVVPAAEIQLDEESPLVNEDTRTNDEDVVVSNSEKDTETADKVVAWMDAVGGDPEFEVAQNEHKEEADIGPGQFFKSLLPGSDKLDSEAGSEIKTVDLSPKLEDVDSEDYAQLSNVRRKRGADGDDYFQATTDRHYDDDDYKAFDEDDYSDTAEGSQVQQDGDSEADGQQQLDDDDYSEESARQQIDREYDDGSSAGAKIAYIPSVSSEVNENADQEVAESESGKSSQGVSAGRSSAAIVQSKRKRISLANRNKAGELIKQQRITKSTFDEQVVPRPLADQTQIGQFNMPDKQAGTYRGKQQKTRAYNRNMDQGSVAIALGNRDGEAGTVKKWRGQRITRRKEQVSADNDDEGSVDGEDGGVETVYASRQSKPKLPPNQSPMEFNQNHRQRQAVPYQKRFQSGRKNQITADADTDYITPEAFAEFDRKQNLPVKRRSSYQYNRKISRRQNSAPQSHRFSNDLRRTVNQVVFDGSPMLDDDYQFDEVGTIEFARSQVCKFVQKQLPAYGFTGNVQDGTKIECDVQCERSDGKHTAVFHIFHLKNWPCGANLKGRCSNDGKCDSTSVR